jgi:hypothetical protein
MSKYWRGNQYTKPAMPSYDTQIYSFIEKAISYEGDDCLIWPFTRNPDGYAHLSSRRFRKQYGTPTISRVVCIEVYGPPLLRLMTQGRFDEKIFVRRFYGKGSKVRVI